MYYILNDRNEPVEVQDIVIWGAFMADVEGRRIGLYEYGGISISTVFLGIDHSIWQSTPILFETLIFGGEFDGEMRRYATFDEALAGHYEMVDIFGKPKVKKKPFEPFPAYYFPN